jgi:hypothetical protein
MNFWDAISGRDFIVYSQDRPQMAKACERHVLPTGRQERKTISELGVIPVWKKRRGIVSQGSGVETSEIDGLTIIE